MKNLNSIRRRHRPPLWLLALVLLLARAALTAPAEEPVPPPEVPAFGAPLEIDHEHFPFRPGAVKVFLGRESGRNVTVIEKHLEEIREFAWNGRTVPCRVVEELQFEDGQLVETDRRYHAQADDGTVYSFGRTEEGEDTDEGAGEEDGEEKEGGGWVVGAARPEDPPAVIEVPEPRVAIPGRTPRRTRWVLEDVPPNVRSEMEVEAENESVKLPAGRLRGCLRIREDNLVEGNSDIHWFAPGIGLVMSRGAGEFLKLNASSLR
jgi:hypothetical protein